MKAHPIPPGAAALPEAPVPRWPGATGAAAGGRVAALSALPVLVLLVGGTGCAAIAASVAALCGTAAANALATTCAEVCGQSACAKGPWADGECGTLACGNAPAEGPSPDDFEERVRGRPTPPGADVDDPYAPPVFCRQKTLPGNIYRLSCADGTLAEAIDRVPPHPEKKLPAPDLPTFPEPVEVRTLADVARLAGRRAVAGDLRVTSTELLRLHLPSLRTVTGQVQIVDNPRLVRAEVPALVRVGGDVVVAHNPVLANRPFPRLADVGGSTEILDNPDLPAAPPTFEEPVTDATPPAS